MFNIVSVAIGTVLCFFGFILHKIVLVLLGLGWGAGLGFVASLLLDLRYGIDQSIYLVIIVVCAILGALLSLLLYRLFIFLIALALSFWITYSIFLSVTNGDSNISLILAAIISVIVAIISLKIHDVVLIITMAFSGGKLISLGISPTLFGGNNSSIENLLRGNSADFIESIVSFDSGYIEQTILTFILCIVGTIVQINLFLKKKPRATVVPQPIVEVKETDSENISPSKENTVSQDQ